MWYPFKKVLLTLFHVSRLLSVFLCCRWKAPWTPPILTSIPGTPTSPLTKLRVGTWISEQPKSLLLSSPLLFSARPVFYELCLGSGPAGGRFFTRRTKEAARSSAVCEKNEEAFLIFCIIAVRKERSFDTIKTSRELKRLLSTPSGRGGLFSHAR